MDRGIDALPRGHLVPDLAGDVPRRLLRPVEQGPLPLQGPGAEAHQVIPRQADGKALDRVGGLRLKLVPEIRQGEDVAAAAGYGMALMETEDISRITISQLCGTAQINRTTFYKYYGSIYDLLAEFE